MGTLLTGVQATLTRTEHVARRRRHRNYSFCFDHHPPVRRAKSSEPYRPLNAGLPQSFVGWLILAAVTVAVLVTRQDNYAETIDGLGRRVWFVRMRGENGRPGWFSMGLVEVPSDDPGIRTRRRVGERIWPGFVAVTNDKWNGHWFATVSGGSGETINWTGALTTAFATAGNWVDQATGVAFTGSVNNTVLARFGTGTGATNTNCATTAGNTCGELSIANAYTGTFSLASGTNGLVVGGASLGAVTLGTGMTLTNVGATSGITYVSTSNNGGTGWPVTTNGKTVSISTFNGVGGRWVLQDNLVSASGANQTCCSVTNGTLVCNGKNLTRNSSSGGTNLSVGAGGTVDFTATGTSTTISNNNNGALTPLVFNAGCTITNGADATLNITSGLTGIMSIDLGTKTFGTINLTGVTRTGAVAFISSGTIKALSCPSTSGHTVRGTAGITLTLSQASALSFTSAITLTATTASSAWTIAAVGETLVGNSVTDITATGPFYVLDGTNGGGNTGVFFCPPNQLPQDAVAQSRSFVPRQAVSRAGRW